MMIAERMRVPDQHKVDMSTGRHFHFPAAQASIRLALRQWRQAMETSDICADLTARAESVLAEVLNNIAEHGQDEAQLGWIDLHCDMIPSGLLLVVTDQGRPLPSHLLVPPQQAAPHPGDYLLADLPEGGFGWSIIRCLACDLQHQRLASGNRLSFVVPLCDTPGAGDPSAIPPA